MASEQLIRQAPARASQERFDLAWIQRARYGAQKLDQQGNVGARKESLDFRRQFEDVGRPRRPTSSSDAPHYTVAFHHRELGADSAGGQIQLDRDFVGGQFPMAEQRNDAASTRLEQLIPKH